MGTYDFACIKRYENYLNVFALALFIAVIIFGGGLL
jgi:ech hydrogenase subunit A